MCAGPVYGPQRSRTFSQAYTLMTCSNFRCLTIANPSVETLGQLLITRDLKPVRVDSAVMPL